MSLYTASAAARRARLNRKLQGSLYVKKDLSRGLNLAWFGDNRVVVFAEDGMEVSVFRVKGRRNPSGRKDAYFKEVVTAISEKIRSGKYPDRVRKVADDSDI
ncbi:MAG: hypothetical protein E6R03_01645 [Hyphomicrobiaceae bacterium]|nr:MAG: hypothetical protein E6R03_01645 [Hyphomicrobiaceae bacterium]